ncbi:hypothetical protein EVAR_25453_1 [Eumeta japonica]|uniref:Uncharacterized protein n=1 Tax=Eumeta variegata TaxID=151549 RepID=A0A4C1VM91_EUMVA|nr:hypothetical protein EVAR_25453_1 [Eumeta japonica]
MWSATEWLKYGTAVPGGRPRLCRSRLLVRTRALARPRRRRPDGGHRVLLLSHAPHERLSFGEHSPVDDDRKRMKCGSVSRLAPNSSISIFFKSKSEPGVHPGAEGTSGASDELSRSFGKFPADA